MNNNLVELDESEMMQGALVGVMRQVENLRKNRRPAHGVKPTNDWQIHIEGCLKEMAFAKFANRYWAGKGKLRAPDVAGFDVRSTPWPDGDLCLHETDPDDRIFWLVCGLNGVYVIKGWIMACNGKKPEYYSDKYKTGRPAYWVPQSVLTPP